MYSVLLLCASLLSVWSATSLRGRELLNETNEWTQFTHFQEKFRKRYETIQELEKRFEIFRDHIRAMIAHNADTNQTFKMGINQFSDLTAQEFKYTYIGNGVKSAGASYGCDLFTATGSDTNLPAEIDWRTKYAVTSVKDQGQCGSCWTFSSTGAVEGAWAISKKKLIDLSEQELVDCATGVSYGSYGCNGGEMEGAFKFILQHGQCALSSYPYTSGTTKTSGTCQSKQCTPVAHIAGCYDVKPNDQLALKAAVAKQPVSVAIEADTRYFQSYAGGILTSTSCGTTLDHGVLIVGYGTDNGQDYWLVKNSWSTSWGENGYVKIARSSSTNDPGVCGIAKQPSFPVV